MKASFRAALVVILTIVSGCSKAPAPPGPGTGTTDSEGGVGTPGGPDDAFAAPANWTVGQWRTYTEHLAAATNEITLVVTDANLNGYRLATTDRRQALYDAENDTSYIGEIDRFNLAGKQGTERVEYFKFPLVANATWSTRWDTATYDVRAIGNVSGAFELEASENGIPKVRYSYDAAAGFFGHIDFLDDGGAVRYQLVLSSHGQNFTGTLVSATVERLHDYFNGASPAGNDAADVQVSADASELILRYGAECPTNGAWTVGIAPAMQDPAAPVQFNDHQQCPTTGERTRVFADPVAGQWEYGAAWTSAPKTLDYHAKILEVTYTETPWPS